MMKKTNTLILFLVAFAYLFAFPNQPVPVLAQDSGRVSISSSCSSCEIGANISVIVTATASVGSLGSLEVNLNYDKDKLSYQSISYFSEANDFSEIMLTRVVENVGLVHVEAGKQGGLAPGNTGRVFVAYFKVLVAGDASFSAGPLDGANQDGRVVLSSSPLSITLVSPPAPNSGNSSGSTTGPVSTGTTSTSDYSKSEVIYDKTGALSDGKDKICLQIFVKNYGKTVTSLKPTLKTEGGLDVSSITLDKDKWITCVSSSVAGSKRVVVSVKGIMISDKTLIFNPEGAAAITETQAPTAEVADVLVMDSHLLYRLMEIKGDVTLAKKRILLEKNTITNIDPVVISGTAVPDTNLRIYIHSTELIQKDVVTDKEGKWNVLLGNPLPVGPHRVEAAIIDQYGNESRPVLIAGFSVQKSYSKMAIIALSVLVLLLLLGLFFFIRWKKRLVIQVAQKIDTWSSAPPMPFYEFRQQQHEANKAHLESLANNSSALESPTPISQHSINNPIDLKESGSNDHIS